MSVISQISKFSNDLVSIRRDLHEHPELGMEEVRTSGIVAKLLKQWGIETHTEIGKTGVVGVLKGNKSGKTIGLRADMDALPIQENTNLKFASKTPGVMHACGHDAHTTMLLGAARYLAETNNFAGTAIFIFQPAEEGLGGARAMLADKLFERFPCDEIYGLHNWPTGELGKVSIKPGPAMAGADIFILTIKGAGGHAAMPHQTRDPIVAAGMITVALQTLVSRQLDPFDQAVVSLTKLEAGSAFNVIPNVATIGGTLRTMKASTREDFLQRIETVAKMVAKVTGCEVSTEIRQGYPPTINHEADALFARGIISDVLGPEGLQTDLTPAMCAEDFSYMLQEKEGAYIWLGAGKESANLHSPLFDFNDDLLPIGASLWVRVVEAKLPNHAS